MISSGVVSSRVNRSYLFAPGHNAKLLRKVFTAGADAVILDLEDAVKQADLVIGAVLVPGAKAPKLVTNSTVAHMKSGAVLVDIAIDQGGCFEDSRPTTHDDPTFAVHDTVFYCVANMPGAVPRTSTYALTNATLPYTVALADKGWAQACREDHSLALGLNTHAGTLTNGPVGEAVGIAAAPLEEALA